jgi:hypothetical protein
MPLQSISPCIKSLQSLRGLSLREHPMTPTLVCLWNYSVGGAVSSVEAESAEADSAAVAVTVDYWKKKHQE